MSELLPDDCWVLILDRLQDDKYFHVCMANKYLRDHLTVWMKRLEVQVAFTWKILDRQYIKRWIPSSQMLFWRLEYIDLSPGGSHDDLVNKLINNKSPFSGVTTLKLPLTNARETEILIKRMPLLSHLEVRLFPNDVVNISWSFLATAGAKIKIFKVTGGHRMSSGQVVRLSGYLPNLEELELPGTGPTAPDFCGFTKLQKLTLKDPKLTLKDPNWNCPNFESCLPPLCGLDATFIGLSSLSIAEDYFLNGDERLKSRITVTPNEIDKKLSKPIDLVRSVLEHLRSRNRYVYPRTKDLGVFIADLIRRTELEPCSLFRWIENKNYHHFSVLVAVHENLVQHGIPALKSPIQNYWAQLLGNN